MGKARRKVVLITGGAGFIGSHLCDLLVNKGYKVICLDNFVTGKIENIKHLLGNPLFEFKKIDVSGDFSVKGKVDFILHFASPASPVEYLRNSIETLKVGSFGTYNCLNLARLKKARFLLASTSEIYGDPLEHPQKESYWGNVNSVGPRSVYDEAKRFAEAITMSYHRDYKLDTRIVRIFNTYGPRMQSEDGRAVPSFIVQALTNKPLTIQGDGSQTRSFCYISDLVEGIFRLMNSSINEPVNLGNPTEVSIKKLATIIIELTHSASAIKYLPLPQDDPARRRPDISRARKYLNWRPKIDLEDGLMATINWFKNRPLRY